MINVSDILSTNILKCKTDIQEIKVENFQKVCRMCLLEEEITNIFELHYEGHFISDLIFYCCTIQVMQNDDYPQNMCINCINQLIVSFEFIYKCCKSNELLKSILSKENIKTEEIAQNFNADADDVKDDNLISVEVKQETDKLYERNLDSSHSALQNINLKFEPIDKRKDSKRNNNSEKGEKKRNKDLTGPPYVCQDCGDSYEELQDLKAHRKAVQHPKLRSFTCTLCTKTFTYKDGLDKHMRTHTKEKPFQCELCFSSFSLSRNLKRHIMIHTGEKPFTCDICGKGFNQHVTLKGHKRIHTGERPYICNYCGKGLKYSTELKTHLNRHILEEEEETETKQEYGNNTTIIKLQCNICKETVSSKRALRLHKSVSHGKKSQLCSICGKGFVGKQGLLSHMKTHTGEKPFKCQYCDRSFAHKMTLKDHILTHTGEKPHECKTCGKRFIQHHHLVHHTRTHTGERPYVCPFCQKGFALKGNLTVHIRTHTGETPYVCTLCDTGFYDSSSLKKHHRCHLKS